MVHVAAAVGGLRLPTLERLGLGCVRPIEGVAPAAAPVLHGRLHPLGPGKDSTIGHWELMGIVPAAPLPTYPDGFPDALIEYLQAVIGHVFCVNRPCDGIAVLEDFGAHHLATGELILYTSADSVLQVAAHDRVLGEEGLRALCATLRGEHAVGRVIARPFTGEPGAFRRTEGRRDFALPPPERSYLDELTDAGVPVHAVGKVHDLFAGVGIAHKHPGANNATALAETTRLIYELPNGLIFTNLIETDQLYGHRKDVQGFAAALGAIDAAVTGWLERLGDGDLLVLTADHGVDPLVPHSDHTREHAPLLA